MQRSEGRPVNPKIANCTEPTVPKNVADLRESAMVNRQSIEDFLRHAKDVLHELRRESAAGGHTESLSEIDSLVAVAEQEAERKLSALASSPHEAC